MIIRFDSSDTMMILSDVQVSQDKDGYFIAQQTEGEIRAVSRNPFTAVAYVLEEMAQSLKEAAKLQKELETNPVSLSETLELLTGLKDSKPGILN